MSSEKPSVGMDVDAMDEQRAAGKRAPNEVDSPASKRHAGGELSLAMLTRLLESQTQELRQSTCEEVRKAVGAMEEATAKRIDFIKGELRDLRKHLSQQEGKLEEVQQNQQSLLERVAKLKAKGSSVGSTTAREPDRRNSLVMGGWEFDTKKEDLLANVDKTLVKLDIKIRADEEPICPGVRRGFVIMNIVERQGESQDVTQERLGSIIRTINSNLFVLASNVNTHVLGSFLENIIHEVGKPCQAFIRSS